MRRLLFVVLLPILLAACGDERRFSPEAWAQTDPMERSAFTGDLISRRLLIGKSWTEVLGMLGSAREFSTDSATWVVGVDERNRPMVLQVDFQDRKAIRARVHRE